MSVIRFETQEWQKLFNTLFYLQENGRFNTISHSDINEYVSLMNNLKDYKKLSDYDKQRKAIREKLHSFIQLLIAANQSAYNLQYGDNFKKIELQEEEISTMNAAQLGEFLGSLTYNCTTNNGYSTLPAEQEKTLLILKAWAWREAYEKLKG